MSSWCTCDLRTNWMKIANSNFFSLQLVNLLGYFFPFLTSVIIARSLESNEYGQYYSIINLANIVAVVIDWGFSLYALNILNNTAKTCEVVENLISGILTAKSMIFFIILPFLLFTDLINFKTTRSEFFCFELVIVSYILNPSYLYFSYRESLTYLKRTIYIRLLYLIILSLIANIVKINVLILMALYAIYSIIFNFVPLFLFFRERGLKFILNFSNALTLLYKTYRLFIGNVFVVFYTSYVIYQLPSVVGLESTGFFGLAFTLVKAFQSLQTPITQIVLTTDGIKIRRITIALQVAFLASLTIFCALFGAPIIKFVYGQRFHIDKNVMECLSLIIFIGGCSSIFTNQIFIKRNYQNKTFFTLFVGAFFSLATTIHFLNAYGLLGAALVMVISEALILLVSISLSLPFFYKSDIRHQ